MNQYLKARTRKRSEKAPAEERPILMNAFSVNGLDKGIKTQTRRLATDDPSAKSIRWVESVRTEPCGEYTGWVKECGAPLLIPIKCRYGVPGDRLWVRERWAVHQQYDFTTPSKIPKGVVLWYTPTPRGEIETLEDGGFRGKWHPSIFMPRWASRFLLGVKKVRAERLQAITREDAIAEGIERERGRWKDYRKGGEKQACLSDPRDSYRTVWDSINAKPKPVHGKDGDGKKVIEHYISYPWDDIQESRKHRGKPWFIFGNPIVFVIVFRRIEA